MKNNSQNLRLATLGWQTKVCPRHVDTVFIFFILIGIIFSMTIFGFIICIFSFVAHFFFLFFCFILQIFRRFDTSLKTSKYAKLLELEKNFANPHWYFIKIKFFTRDKAIPFLLVFPSLLLILHSAFCNFITLSNLGIFLTMLDKFWPKSEAQWDQQRRTGVF